MRQTSSSIKGVIRESYYSSRMRLAESQSGVPDGMMRVTGIAAVIGVKNRNNRTYTEDNYTYWIDKLQPVIKAGKLFGELEHPDSDNINMNNVSHKIEALWYDKKTKTVYITLILLDTEKGKIAQSVIKAGGTISVSSRANGSVNNMGYAQIDDLITYDIVGTPGFKESELKLSENYVRFGNKIKECLMFATADQVKKNSVSLCEALGTNNTYSKYHIINYKDMATNKKMRIREANIRKVKAALRERRAASRKNGFNEAQSAQLINFLTESFAPLFIGYLSKNGIISLTESKAKSVSSFGQYARKFLFESEVETGVEVLDKVDSPLEEEEEENIEKLEESLKRTKRALREARKKLHEAEENDLDEEEKEELQDKVEELQDKVEELQDKIDEACDNEEEEEDEEEEINESLKRLNTRINRKRTYLAEARKKLREADEEEKEEIEDAIEDLKDEIKSLEDKVNEAKKTSRRKKVNEDYEEDDCMDCELTNEDIETMSDEDLQSYLDANENKASTDECGITGQPEMQEDEEEPMTPGAAEELMDSEEENPMKEEEENPENPENEEVESPFMPEEENPENPENEEVESPFMREARKSMKKQSRLVESIRKRYSLNGDKKKPLR